MSDEKKEQEHNYTADIQDVYAAEKEYLSKRQEVNQITEEEAEETWGICFSSGGVRAAIVSLGIVQRLMKSNFFRRFDYMSTVSGGGFIAGCLTSLLTGASSAFGKFGVNPDNSPFLNTTSNEEPDPSRPTPQMQLDHLKKARGFLPEVRLTGLSFNSLLGVWMGGWLFSFFAYLSVLFFVAVSSVAFLEGVSVRGSSDNFVGMNESALIGSDSVNTANIIDTITFKGYIIEYYSDLGEESSFTERISIVGNQIVNTSKGVIKSINILSIPILLFFAIAGFLFSLIYAEFLRFTLKANSHRSIIVKKAKRYILSGLLYMYAIIFTGGLLRGISRYFDKDLTPFPEFSYWLVFIFPFAMAVGMTLGTHVMSIMYYSLNLKVENLQDLKFAISGVKGSNLLILSASFVAPFVFMSSLWIGGVVVIVLAFILFVFGAYWTLIKSKIALRPSAGNNFSFRWTSNILAALIIYFSFSGIVRFLIWLFDTQETMIFQAFIVSLVIMIVLFLFSQGNRSNLHNFLKLKLAAAILVTEKRLENGNMENLRNDRSLKLHEVGDNNFSGPYHIINAAVNVHQSDENYRQERKAMPFFFTKHFVGSEVTNYVRTEAYQNGNTRLLDALANSTAFIHSGMGIYNFWAQSFLITALNFRLGAWIHNPLYYQTGIPKSRVNHAFRNIVKEFIGRFDERSRYINVSDGIHTGDNFGLIPLLMRECSHIVLCDFTTDKEYLSLLDRFEQTAELAMNYGVRKIEIDPTKFRPQDNQSDNGFCESCVQVGKIEYKSGKVGTIFYLKSLLSEKAPEELKTYYERDASFPFESLTKQTFEASKFEMYRNLGEHVAEEFLNKQNENTSLAQKNEQDETHNELLNYLDILISRSDDSEEIAKLLEIDPNSQALLEEINGRIEGLRQRLKIENAVQKEGLLKNKLVLLEKLNYLRTVKAKLADGTEKFEILRALEDTEKELREIEESINKLSNE